MYLNCFNSQKGLVDLKNLNNSIRPDLNYLNYVNYSNRWDSWLGKKTTDFNYLNYLNPQGPFVDLNN